MQEKLLIGNKELLTRDESGIGEIWAQQLDMNMKFKTPTKELAAVNRREAVQHPFLDDLYQWANFLRFYEFGTQLGKDVISHIPQKIDFLKDKTDFKDYDYVGYFVWVKMK